MLAKTVADKLAFVEQKESNKNVLDEKEFAKLRENAVVTNQTKQ